MTDIETIPEKRHIYSETGRTSPLSDLPTSSPSISSSGQQQPQMTTTKEQFQNSKGQTPQASTNGTNLKISSTSTLTKEERSKSIASDESSDLSDLDSEAETERMYNGDSQLSKIAKREDDTTLQDDQEDEEQDNTIIKEDYIDQLAEDKDDEIDIEKEDVGSVVEKLKGSEEPEEEESTKIKSVKIEKETEESNGNGHSKDGKKRKLSIDSTETAKKRKTSDNEDEVEENKGEEKPKVSTDHQTNETIKDSNSDTEARADVEDKDDEAEEDTTVTNLNGKKTDGEDEHVDEAEDEDVEDEAEDEDEEEELTEEQKAEKQKELEVEQEKQKQRKEAIQYLTEIEIDFAKLRDRLYEDKMSRFKSELEMCLNGSHPELQNVYSKIDSHTEEKIRLASLSQKYKFECIDRKTRAQRTAVHQQYFKRVSEFKAGYLKDITKEWYKINKERRVLDALVPEYSYKVPEYVDDLVDQRAQVNEEISILVGLNKYYGFPEAPNLKPIEGEELNDDLKAMNIL